MTASLALRPYQTAAIEAIGAAAARGVNRQLVVLPTGTGKTIVFSHLVDGRVAEGRALILAHREELLDQARDKLQLVNPQLGIGIVQAGRNEFRYPVTIASVPTLMQPRRRAQVGTDFGTVIVDEAHHAPADSFRTLLESLGCFNPDGPLTVGFTATPDRGDKVGLAAVFSEIVYHRDLASMISDGYLADIIAERIELEVDLREVQVQHGDLVDGQLSKMLMNADGPRHIAQAYEERATGRTALLFTPTVVMAEACALALQERGIRATWLSGETPSAERHEIIERLHRGDLDVVANCAVLTEGFDEPRVDCIIVARPTKSRPLYQQMIGRGCRLFPGKDNLLILDVVGVTERHDLVTPASILGLPLSALKKSSAREALEAAEQQALGLPTSNNRNGELRVRQTIALSSRLKWSQVGGVWILQAGERSFALAEKPAGWVVAERSRGEKEWKVIQRGLDMGYAQGFAEDRAREIGATYLVDTSAAWRTKPVSEKQKGTLLKFGLLPGSEWTAGDASDAISMAIARSQARQKVPA